MVNEMETTQMKEFFDQVIARVNELTGTAAQVEGLKQQISDLTTRVNELAANNYNLQQSLTEANSQIQRLTDESHSHSSAAASANEHVNALKQVIIDRDNEVVDLRTSVNSEQESHRITRADLEDARRAVQEWEANYNRVKDELSVTQTQSAEWRNRANEYQRKAEELQQKLDKVMSVLYPLQVVSGDVAVG
jgi:chromosome segregation ATPase